ncbi:MAG TPA: hypothetical protein VFJ24_06890 [Gaiellales bacterium]|nr:hypothetical protein [Gaiellales bacterium]
MGSIAWGTIALAIAAVLVPLPHLLLRAASAQSAPQTTQAVFASEFRAVFVSVLSVLQDRKIPVSFASTERGLIRTGSVPVSQQRLRQMTTMEFQQVVDRRGKQGGRFVLEVAVSTHKDNKTSVGVKSMIVMTDAESQSPAGGQVLPSSGVLEREILTALKMALRSR